MAESRKRAQILIVSVLSIVICGVMLLGTAYAWFQETVTADITITAETVSAALLDAEGKEVNSVAFYEVLQNESSTNPEVTTLHTEPATVWDLDKTYQTVTMTLANTGSLKTKYTISVEGIEEALKEAFVFEVLLNGEDYPVPLTGELGVDENDATVSFAIQAQLDADKAAMAAGVSLENMVINIIAEQAE